MKRIEIADIIYSFSPRPAGHNIKCKLQQNNVGVYGKFAIANIDDPNDEIFRRQAFIWSGENGLRTYWSDPISQAMYVYNDNELIAKCYFTNLDA